MYGGVQMYGGVYQCTGHRHMRWCTGAYRCMGTYRRYTDVWHCTDVQGAYRCISSVQMYEGVFRCTGQTDGGCMGAYKSPGGVQMYGGIQMYRGHTDVWGMYRSIGSIQIYGGCTPPNIHTARHSPTCLQTTPRYYISYKFKFVPYRHILLAYWLA